MTVDAYQDPDVALSLEHGMKRLKGLARAAGVYVDAYMALSLLEVGLGGLLQRLPRVLPVVQTRVRVLLVLYPSESMLILLLAV